MTQQESRSQVTSKQIELKIEINAQRERVWQAIVEEIGQWWRKDFFVYENAKLILEPYPGGRLYEDAGNGAGGLWFTVMNISPPTMLEFYGHLAPQWGGPATTIVRLTLKESGDITTLHVSDALFGCLTENTEKQVSEGWRMLFGEGLKQYVEKKIGKVA